MARVTNTVSGAVASFKTPGKVPIRSLKAYFSPKQEGSGDPSPENVRPISGWTGINAFKTGKNLFDEQAFDAQEDYPYSGPYGYKYSDTIQLKPNTQYKASTIVKDDSQSSDIDHFAIRAYSGYDIGIVDPSVGNRYFVQSGSPMYLNTYTLFTTGPTGIIRFGMHQSNTSTKTLDESIRDLFKKYSFQIELGSTATDYEPYNGTTIPVDWETEAGTIYSGYVDLITGEVVKTWSLLDMSTPSWYYNKNNQAFISSTVADMRATYGKGQPNWVFGCSAYASNSENFGTMPDMSISSSYQVRRQAIHCKDSRYTDPTVFRSAVQGVMVVYPLETPVIVATLDPVTLSTLRGQNNIWSNADDVEVEYDFVESAEILTTRRKLWVNNAPHIETASGGLVTVNTDVAAPLKSCKVEFAPVQEGTGDPAPDNVRPITGWTGLEVYRTGKNLFPAATGIDMLENHPLIDGARRITISGLDPLKSYTFQATWNTEWETEGGKRIYVNGATSAMLRPTTGEIAPIVKSVTVKPSAEGIIFVTAHNTPLSTNTAYAASLVNMQLEEGSTATSYEPYNGVTIPIDWQSEAGTIYGGYVDLISGELVQEYDFIDLEDISWTDNSNRCNSSVIEDLLYNESWSSTDKEIVGEQVYQLSRSANLTNYPNAVAVMGSHGNAYLRKYFDGTNYPKGKIAYKKANPIRYQLDPLTLSTLRGQNNIWSNANGDVTIKYWKH